MDLRNIPSHIENKVGKNLHLQRNHPLSIIYKKIAKLFDNFTTVDSLNPIVSIEENFDLLRIPADHPSRSLSDTYYWNNQQVLRTHTSAHQISLLKKGLTSFLVCGDVYRKDDIDATHYPVFHQLEGVHLCDNPEQELQATLSRVVEELFDAEYRFKPDYFPFTHPSWEVEVNFNGNWLEVLGCGVIHPEVLANAGIQGKTGWAFGLGLERLAMIIFNIPDIRLFWSEDSRFLDQFSENKISKFEPYSKYPPCWKDIAFWIPEGEAPSDCLDCNGSGWHANEIGCEACGGVGVITGHRYFQEREMLDIIRGVGGDLIESVSKIDEFKDIKKNRSSLCYRVVYRDLNRSLTNEEINLIQNQIRSILPEKLKVVIR